MRRVLPILLLFMLLAACGTQDAVQTTDEPALESSDSAADTAAKAESKPKAGSAEAITPAETAAEAGAVRDRDWTQGADDPLITIIEYGDFQ